MTPGMIRAAIDFAAVRPFVRDLTCTDVQSVFDTQREWRGEFVLRAWQTIRREAKPSRDSAMLVSGAMAYVRRGKEWASK